MQLRNYQERAVREVYHYLRTKSGNPCIVIPTGGGKTPVIATLCRDAVLSWDGRVLVVAHVKELLEQSHEKLQIICPTINVGLYSAGLKRRDTTHPVIVGGIQSIYDKSDQLGRFDLLIIDEAHLIPESGDGMYRQLINGLIEINPDIRIIGLTATPYRTGSGLLCKKDGILNNVCYEVSVPELIARGFLSKLTHKAAINEADTDQIKIVRGEFDEKEAEQAFIVQDVVNAAAKEVLLKTRDRKSVLIFCQTIAHAETVANILRWECHEIKEIYGNTPSDERAESIAAFRNGRIKYLINVNVLTTGFDAPNVDCVVLLRATVSPGLYYQMVGRGFRLCEGKENCLVLDFGKNVVRHGPVDAIKPKNKRETGERGRKCSRCQTVCGSTSKACPDCGYVFPEAEERKPNHTATSGNEEIVSSDEPTEIVEDREVTSVTYKVHVKRGADESHPRTMRVSYQLANPVQWVSEWVCVEHTGFARRKAESWWRSRTVIDCPTNADAAVEIAEDGELIRPQKIKLKHIKGKDYPEIVGYDLPTFEEIESQEIAPMSQQESTDWLTEIPW